MQIIFTRKAHKDLRKLERATQKRIDKAIKEKLEINHEKHLLPLAGSLNGLFKFRVGDYLIICKQ